MSQNSLPTTEQSSLYDGLDLMSTNEILQNINQEDAKVAAAVQKTIPKITTLVDELVVRFNKGGRLFYIGAGTSGRLGVVDASEIPPTFGMDFGAVIGIIAGGDTAIRKAVEFAEDDLQQAWKDLKEFDINENDVLVGIAASGRTPYVIGGVEEARKNNILTACIVCNENSQLASKVDIPIEAIVGPEFLTGSTRMKSGTAQKLILNMITTALMIRIGKVKGNKMVNMQLSNIKLVDRAIRMIVEELHISREEAQELLEKHGNVHNSIANYKK
jgi:N-acetylmuramic acid 6-phosphate etherase